MCVFVCICSANFICSYLIGFSGPQFTVTLCNVSILPSARSSQQTQQHSVSVPLSVQITAARHAIKTDCAVGVSAVCNNFCDILVQKNIFNTEIQVIFCVYLSRAVINSCTLAVTVVTSECRVVPQDSPNVLIILY